MSCIQNVVMPLNTSLSSAVDWQSKAMAFNPFIGWTQAELELELRRAQDDFAAGASVSSSSAGDTTGSYRGELSAKRRIELILKALYLLDPATYPLDQIVSIDRTVFKQPSSW